MVRDLTVGSPGSILWRFCLPMFGSIVFQQLYNIADIVIVGRTLGVDALAAVGATAPLFFLIIRWKFALTVS